ncbi:unnamed protein product (macronuclear) [Paramecium tetraurelia]|uniref:Chromosome undetermined scaffold_1, whole genome shotgun sequence n=1 Tax=Paramecium tetraurelia TaxID=5888 RepID=Q6BFE1_PARTE|nr:hypothetical protein [Paramecium tetraurelia strain d4-2]XP_001423003.1 uncharacterized protein GSPATT00000040001 [Paramecium tetraurelia]CAH03630.1 hypothetical protein, Zn-finger domain [Paramecium tetraurelia]CAK55605.1 unnamed protein product [Paramecium tetraurelia]|eukprot:XP_001423003.1 hypothetical protein (macronuclear) [Paramecium tetraurelia strain d4-2]
MKSSQQLIFGQVKQQSRISSYLNLYEYNESSVIGIQSLQETDVTIQYSYQTTEECFYDCKNDSECRNSFCICREQQIGNDCHLVLDNIQTQYMFQGFKMYYLDIKQYYNLDYVLKFQSNSKYITYCIIDSMNPNLIQLNVNSILNITKSDIASCQKKIESFQKQFNQTVNFYYLVYFDNLEITYLNQSNDAADAYQLIIILTTIIGTLLFLIIVCTMRSKFQKKSRVPKRINLEPKNLDENAIITLMNRFCPSQEYGALITRQNKYLVYEKCSICQDTYNHGTQIRLTFCEHLFHTPCIDKWLDNHKVIFQVIQQYCPECQSPFDLINIRMQCKSQKQLEMLQWSYRMDEVIMKNDPLVNQSNQHQSFSQVESIRNSLAFEYHN